MRNIEILTWDDDYRVHAALILVNILLFISLLLRFEWPLIKKRLRTADSDIEKNKHADESRTNGLNGLYNSKKMPSNTALNKMAVPTASGTISPSANGMAPIHNISGIQLTKIDSGHDLVIEEEKYIIEYQNTIEKDVESMKITEHERKLITRRKASSFYADLFNVDNFDDKGKWLSGKKRNRIKNMNRKTQRQRKKKKLSFRNDSLNVELHQKAFNTALPAMVASDDEIDGEVDASALDGQQEDEHDDEYPPELHQMKSQHYEWSRNWNLANILSSRIYDDSDKNAVRFRYRYILYAPCLILMVLGVICLILSEVMHMELYIAVYYGYPALGIVLSVVLWCEIDIVILSCGGAHVVEECLEVQISANGDEYQCIYCCCWCNCLVRFCNACFCKKCAHDNAFSLFKCHHKFMKIIVCFICPILTALLLIISEIPEIREPLILNEIGDINHYKGPSDPNHSDHWRHHIATTSIYWLLFVTATALYFLLMLTAICIGVLIVRSLDFVSSLPRQTLSVQYVTSIIITFVMQIQFVMLLVYFNLFENGIVDPDIENKGLCSPTPFYMLLVYVELVIAGIVNHLSFRNNDFSRFGRDAIEKNEVQLFDFQPDFDSIHDLHNYRRVYGESFLWDIDHGNVAFVSAENVHNKANLTIHNRKSSIKSSKPRPKTPLMAIRDTLSGKDVAKRDKKVKMKKHSVKKQKSRKSTYQSEDDHIELESVIDNDETDHTKKNKNTSKSITREEPSETTKPAQHKRVESEQP